MSRRRRVDLSAAVLIGLLAASLMATPAAAAGGDTIKVIINFRGAERLAGPVVQRLVRGADGHLTHRFKLINSASVSIPAGMLEVLRNNPLIESVELDARIEALEHGPDTDNAELEAAWGVEHIGAGFVHAAGNSGQGVKVGIIDTGIDYNHPDLDSVYAGGWDFFNNDADPFDDQGHGTHVAGILAAEANDPSAGVVGVAPGASLYAYKVLGADGTGEYSGLIAALERAALVDDVDVVNMSLGGHEPSAALAGAVSAAYATGTVLVAASGNVNPFNIYELLFGCPVVYPAAYPEVFATTFTGQNNELTGYSCTGPQVDFASPGDLINSTVPTGACALCDPSGYRADMSGTSMASPHLAGTVALVLAHGIDNGGDQTTLADDVKAHLCANTMLGFGVLSSPIAPTDTRYPLYFGCGVVDANQALVVNPPDVTPPPPTNNSPLAADDSAITLTDTPVVVDVLANDSDPDSDPLSVDSVTSPTDGTAAIVAGGIQYTPNAGFVGDDEFTYSISDGNGGSASAKVNVTVEEPLPPPNQQPVAADDSATTPQDTPVTVSVLANDSDPDSDPLTLDSVTTPAHGTALVVGSQVEYTPAAGFVGTDSFGYSISDGQGGTDFAVVDVTVTLPAGQIMHVADLDNTSTVQTSSWTARVRIRVHGNNHSNLSGVTVTGTFSNGATRTCKTGSTGLCTVKVTGLSKTARPSVTFTVTSLVKTGRIYTPSVNHDPELDSNGTLIVVNKP